MEATAKTQRRQVRRKPAGSAVIHIEMKDGVNGPHWVTGDLVDIIDSGCGLALPAPLTPGSTVLVRGKWSQNRAADQSKAGVRWCVRRTDGTFRAGLQFVPDEERTNSRNPDKLDCYEVMQLSPHADRNIISHVYRMLALRYHPDNAETGNSEKFIRLSKAYQTGFQ